MEAVGQPFNTAVSFGSEAQITLNRQGDLIYYMYIVIDLPAITACKAEESCGMQTSMFPAAENPCVPCAKNDLNAYADYLSDNYTDITDPDEKDKAQKKAKDRYMRDKYGACSTYQCCDDADDCPDVTCDDLATPTYDADGNLVPNRWAHWVNSIGQFLIRAARIVIGGSTIDTLYNDFIFMWEELTGKSGRRLTEMVGKRYSRSTLLCDSRIRRLLYVPLPFWFTQHSGQALALASLQFHGVQLMVEFERLERCIVVSHKDVQVKNCATACCLTAGDLTACLETCYVYLDTVERDRFATTHYEILIVQHQAFQVQSCSSQVRMQLNFNHPVIELMWAVRRKCNSTANSHFNYSGIDGRDPVTSCALFLNNQSRFSNRPGVWFRLVQPYQFHTNIPDCYMYVYSFALHPEDHSPSGSCNFSRIDHVDLALQLQDSLAKETVDILVFARSWNVLRFREGLAGLAYAN